jgi:HTH-type transcriptional regulator / antitoxin HigA
MVWHNAKKQLSNSPITNEIEWRNIQQRINTNLDKKNLTQEDRDYLRVLGMLVYDYEQKFEGSIVLRVIS